MNKEFLKITNLNYKIENKTILKNLNLSIAEGEFVAIMGPSGCGKTTLLRIISGLAKQTSGVISVNNQILADENNFIEPEARNLGLVVQEKVLFPHLNVKNNIMFGLKTKAMDSVNKMVDQFKINKLLDHYPHQLSGGEAQRVALTRTLVTAPKLLLLDEPFNGLDEKLKKDIYPDLQELLKQNNTTTIMVSHNTEEVQELSDRSYQLTHKNLQELTT
jgi:iron(III) transport system ATP-binding protein|tara:strand:+ start:3141 stop:3794 length:654 start_codon:yes stop_codon:yes gene_type:complete